MTLSPREREILELVAVGHGLHSIAAELGITRATVRTMLDSIRYKLGLHSLWQLAAWAWWSGWLRRDPSAALAAVRGTAA